MRAMNTFIRAKFYCNQFTSFNLVEEESERGGQNSLLPTEWRYHH